ncbi:MAG TPA: caspase family protein, partial [Chitinophagaceae bacterium]
MNSDKTKVILVGNSKFPRWGDESKDIPNVEQNLERLRKIFFDNSYFGIPNDDKHFTEIINENSQDVLLKVKHETKSFEDKDQFERLIFYYSGHGIPGEDRKLFFATNDTVRRDYEITSVDSNRLFSYLKGFGAKELIVILDCCYAAQTKENQGDADSLIENSLPKESQEIIENGAYYLFAAGKDNVAKFNPRQPNNPTYFTTALLSSIALGTEPGKEYVKIGELYTMLCKEINNLKKTENNPGIPDPRPVLEGEVSGFLFCKNKNFQNEEDLMWLDILKDPNLKKISTFEDEY